MALFYLPALVVAFLITLLELTEVVALVFALGADRPSVRPVAWGAVGGTSVIAVVALASGATLAALPRTYLLWFSAVLLAAFGVFLFRSTLRSYRRQSLPATAAAHPRAEIVAFGGGFWVGAIETTEAAIVLVALAAAGYGFSALVGAVVGGVVLVALAAVLHDRIRRIKVPWLKLGGTSLLFAFATFWAGEAAGVSWPGGDLILIPLVAVAILGVRGGVAAEMRGTRPPSPT
ncbi:MAG: hypothetical protein ACRECT_05680 [Thermoplasmata archaeon]